MPISIARRCLLLAIVAGIVWTRAVVRATVAATLHPDATQKTLVDRVLAFRSCGGDHGVPLRGMCVCPLSFDCAGANCTHADVLFGWNHTVGGNGSLTGFRLGQVRPKTHFCVAQTTAFPQAHLHQPLAVLNGAEGMASWVSSVSEMMLAARLLHRPLVLPCVLDGRLHPCTIQNPKSIHAISVPSSVCIVMNCPAIEAWMGRGGLMSFQNFQKRQLLHRTEHPGSILCMHYKGKVCESFTRKNQTSDGYGYFANKLPTVRGVPNTFLHFVNFCLEHRPAAFYNWGRGAVSVTSTRSRSMSQKHTDAYGVVQMQLMDHRSDLASTADLYHEQLRLSPDFFVLHWRSESTNCDMAKCAETLARGAQQVIGQHYNGSGKDASGQFRCLLISDIPFDKTKPLWGTPYFQAPTRMQGYSKALAILGVGTAGTLGEPEWGGCRKIDELDLTHLVGGMGAISQIEKGLGQKATRLWTCKGKKVSCGGCARGTSRFADSLIGLRAKAKKRTDVKWPETWFKNTTSKTLVGHVQNDTNIPQHELVEAFERLTHTLAHLAAEKEAWEEEKITLVEHLGDCTQPNASHYVAENFHDAE